MSEKKSIKVTEIVVFEVAENEDKKKTKQNMSISAGFKKKKKKRKIRKVYMTE